MSWLHLLDWSSSISSADLVAAVQLRAAKFFDSLNFGVVHRRGRDDLFKHVSSSSITSLFDSGGGEFYGASSHKDDPTKSWESYFLIKDDDGSRELIMCAQGNILSCSDMIGIINSLGKIGSLGYGYGGSEFDHDLLHYIIGISSGYPSNDEQRDKALKLSRWFTERLSMRGSPARKRYLNGMYRDLFRINIITHNHLVTLRSVGGPEAFEMLFSKSLIEVGEENFLWIPGDDEKDAAREILSECGLMI